MFTTVSRSVKRSSRGINWSYRNLINFAILKGKEKDFFKLSLQLEGTEGKKDKTKSSSVQESMADLRLLIQSCSLSFRSEIKFVLGKKDEINRSCRPPGAPASILKQMESPQA